MGEQVIEISTGVFRLLLKQAPAYVSWSQEKPGPTQQILVEDDVYREFIERAIAKRITLDQVIAEACVRSDGEVDLGVSGKTKVSLCIPIIPAKKQKGAPLMPNAVNTTVVYIVDQDESVRKSLSHLMHSAGLRSQNFSSTEGFLAKVGTDPKGCILLDMSNPVTDLQLQVELKRRGIDLPVIAFSTQDDAKTRNLAQQLGAEFFFRRPVDDQALLDTIHWILTLKSHD